MNAIETLNSLTVSNKSSFNVLEIENKCYSAMNDDFNTPILIAHLFDAVKRINSIKSGKEKINVADLKKLKVIFKIFCEEILGLVSSKHENDNDYTSNIMDLILKLRSRAKNNKDFETADFIRDELEKAGIQIKDGRDGSNWEIK